MKDTEKELDAVHEQERTWRDPSAHHFRTAVNRWLRGGMARLSVVKVRVVLRGMFHDVPKLMRRHKSWKSASSRRRMKPSF